MQYSNYMWVGYGKQDNILELPYTNLWPQLVILRLYHFLSSNLPNKLCSGIKLTLH